MRKQATNMPILKDSRQVKKITLSQYEDLEIEIYNSMLAGDAVYVNENDPLDVRIASATSRLDELANDPNIPLHGRTLIWNIMSRLEEIA